VSKTYILLARNDTIRKLRHGIITSHHECEAMPTVAPQPMSMFPALFTYNVAYVTL